jgi:5S rRNA maturation endonuclease (ribonuclease M5)
VKKYKKYSDDIYKVRKLIEDINKISNLVIVVEGKSDFKGLRELGIMKKIVIFNSQDFRELLDAKNVSILILVDFDKEGQKLDKKLSNLFGSLGLRVLKELRQEFRRVTKVFGNDIYSITINIKKIKSPLGYNY